MRSWCRVWAEATGGGRATVRDVFKAAGYLGQYFMTPSDEDRFTLRFWVEQARHLRHGARVLEYGGGPALSSPLVLARRAGEIHFADYVPDALGAVRSWIAAEPGAHDWRPYTRVVLELEGAATGEAAVGEREAALRRRLTRVTACDATTDALMVDPEPPYGAIAAHHCLDVAARDRHEFERMVCRLAAWLEPGGLFLLSVTTGATSYAVEGTPYPCLDLDAAEVRAALVAAGIDPTRIAQAQMPVAGEEYTGVLLSAGWKQA